MVGYRELLTLHGHEGAVVDVGFSPDGQRVLSGGNDGTCRVWDVESGDLAAVITLPGLVKSTAFGPDGRQILCGSSDHSARLFDIATRTEMAVFEGHSGAVVGVAMNPNGRLVLTGSEDGTLKLWDARSGKCIYTMLGDDRGEYVTWTPDGLFVASPEAQSQYAHLVHGTELDLSDEHIEERYQPNEIEKRVAQVLAE